LFEYEGGGGSGGEGEKVESFLWGIGLGGTCLPMSPREEEYIGE
jgi:hypothetical protein